LGVLQADFRSFTLALGIEQSIICRRHLKDDLAMSVIEGQVRREQVRFGQIDGAASATEIEDQVLHMDRRFEYSDCLPVKELPNERGLSRRGHQGDRGNRGEESAPRNP
jgi:hypothetical protein